MTNQPGQPVLQAPPCLWAGECWGVPQPPLQGLQLCSFGGEGILGAALADRCLRISSLPAARRQVSLSKQVGA